MERAITVLDSVQDQGVIKHVRVTSGSFAFEMVINHYGGRDYFKLCKYKKWSQDGKYHPDKSVSIELSDFSDKVFPLIVDMLGKQVV